MRVIDLGDNVAYDVAMARMRAAIERVDVDGPVLLLQQHTPIITTTRTGGTAFVHTPVDVVRAQGIDVHETDRGGDVTFHGPGQLVGYPVVRIAKPGERADLVGYVRALETALVRACVKLGVVDAHGKDGFTGVWCDAPVVDDETLGCNFVQMSRAECKLVAIGVGVGKGVSRHGFAMNITTDLERYTRHITACGLVGKGVTSLERVLARVPTRDDVVRAVIEAVVSELAAVFPG